MCIEVRFERVVTNYICWSYDAALEMAIADVFHCENIPDNVIKSCWFKKMLKQARLVDKDFNVAILKSLLDFDNVHLFGPMQVTESTGIDLDMIKVYGEKLKFERYYLNLYLYSDFKLSVLTIFSGIIQIMMTQMITKSVLVKQCTCHGLTILTDLNKNMLLLHGLFLWYLKSVLKSMRGWLVICRKRLRQLLSSFILPPAQILRLSMKATWKS